MSVVLKDSSKIDRLSQLPPELLDDIFDLVASSYELCSVSPSKWLLPLHEKALLNHLKFESFFQFQKFAETIEAQPTKAASTRGATLRIYFDTRTIDNQFVQGVVSKLSPTELELGGHFDSTTLFYFGIDFGHFANLDTFVIRGYRPASLVIWISRIPTLRTIEFIDVGFGADVFSYPTAEQITKLRIHIPYAPRSSPFAPLYLLPFFPSASIVKLDIVCIGQSQYDAIPPIISKLTPSLRILRLRSAFGPSWSPSKPLDKVLPRFPSIQKLHLDATFLPNDYENDLLSLHTLVDLKLNLRDLDSTFIKVLEGPRRLRYLKKLRIEFGPNTVGQNVDLNNAALEHGEEHWDQDGNGIQLVYQTESFTEMGDWGLSLGDEMMSGMELVEAVELAEKMERTASESDINVSTNLKAVRQAFYRQLVEYHNRGIGKLHLSWDRWLYDDALEMAKRLEVNLPVLEIDLKERIESEKLEWFKVRMRNVEVDGKGKCYAFNLRLKKE
ncbi:hypothetical protein JCM5353_005472 [Sporobolomyces roseus]